MPVSLTTTPCEDAIERDDRARTMRLSGDCVLTEMMTIGDGWTLDGMGHAIVVGDEDGTWPDKAVLLIDRATVTISDLLVDGRRLKRTCSEDDPLVVLKFQKSSANVTKVAVEGNAGEQPNCGFTIGIQALGKGPAPVQIVDSTIRRMDAIGVQAAMEGAMEVSGTLVVDSGMTNLGVYRGGQLTIGEESALIGGEASAVVNGAGSHALFEHTHLGGSTIGIDVTNSATVTLDGSAVLKSFTGLRASDGTSIDVRPGTEFALLGIGIHLTGGATGTISGALFEEIDFAGIAAFESDGLIVTESTFREIGDSNSDSAVLIQLSGGEAAITSNSMEQVSLGVNASGDAGSILVADNSFTEVSFAAIRLAANLDAEVTGNVIIGPTAPTRDSIGIRVEGTVRGTIQDNTVSGYVRTTTRVPGCAISIGPDAQMSAKGNDFPPPGNTRSWCGPMVPLPTP